MTHFWLCWIDRVGRIYDAGLYCFLERDAEKQRAEIWSRIHGGPMKKKDRAALKGGLVHAADDKLLRNFPLLHEWMTAARYDGHEGTREAPTLTIWASGGQWRCSLRDRAEGLVMWLVGDTVLEVLKLAESFCQDEAGPWRVDDQNNPNNGKRHRRG